ncbi:MAG: hypothetical protein IKA95_00140 [Clostridia bacterium]|nr:hypothetical protein [Clostridia bacterium]
MLPIMRTNVRFDEKTLKTFGGINVCEDSATGELCMSENMSSHLFPSLGVRNARSVVASSERIINGMGSFEGCIYTSYTPDAKQIYFTFGGVDYDLTSYSASNDFTKERKFASLSDTILIVPDNVVFSVKTKKLAKATLTHIQDATTAKTKFRSEAPSSSILDSQTIDYIGTLDSNKLSIRNLSYTYSGYSRVFNYASFPDIFKAGVVINLKLSVYASSYDDSSAYYAFIDKMAAGITLKIKSVTPSKHMVSSGVITETIGLNFDDNSINLSGLGNVYVRSFTVERAMPELESICAYDNRVWGISGKTVYASKLGDATEWNDFSVDSYGTLPYASFSTEAPTEGKFTAIVPYGNYIYAFKENAIHKIYGDEPDEYTLHTDICRGVGEGMTDCVSIGASSIIYASSDGVYIYRGDYPRKISQSIGKLPTPISAAATEEFYYILCSQNGRKLIYVYDLRRGIWHRETAPDESLLLTSASNEVYLAAGGTLWCLTQSSDDESGERIVRWKMRMRVDDRLFGKKGYGRLAIRYSLGRDASFTVRAIYDDSSRGAVCGARYDEADSSGASLLLPIKRCLWFELEFSGRGEFVLKSMSLKFYRGSEI